MKKLIKLLNLRKISFIYVKGISVSKFKKQSFYPNKGFEFKCEIFRGKKKKTQLRKSYFTAKLD